MTQALISQKWIFNSHPQFVSPIDPKLPQYTLNELRWYEMIKYVPFLPHCFTRLSILQIIDMAK
jgi:hypothetical protein